MQGHRIRHDDMGMTFLMKAIVLLICFAVVLAVYLSFFAYKAPAVQQSKVAEMTDTVRISYIGYFENGLVFDTSISSVGDDNASWPKALSFQTRSSYSDFSFVVGKTDCTSGQTDCAILGMSDAVLRQPEGASITHTITPAKGYGNEDPTLVTTRTIVEQLPVKEVMNYTVFQRRYGFPPVDSQPVRDPFWGWMSLVHVSGGLVTVQNSPDISGSYPIYVNKTKGGTWSVTVESIDDGMNNGTGAITIMNRFLFLGGNKLMVSDATLGDFFVTDNGDGTFTVDKNKEVVGVNLVFRITILQITKAG